MILWTPMPMELVMENSEETELSQPPVEVSYQGKSLLVQPLDLNKGKIIRLLSTEPRDYLLEELQPGNIISLS